MQAMQVFFSSSPQELFSCYGYGNNQTVAIYRYRHNSKHIQASTLKLDI